MNNISYTQNESKFLSYQFGARICYERVTRLLKMSILSFIAVAIIELYFAPIKEYEEGAMYLLTCLFICQFIIIAFIKVYTSRGAYYKSKFDYLLFEMEPINYNSNEVEKFEEYLDRIIRCKKIRYSKEIVNNGESKKKGVKDWYFNIDSNLCLDDAILICQKQNIYISKKFSRISIVILSISIISLVSSLLLITFIRRTFPIAAIIQLLPILILLITTLKDEITFCLNIFKIETILSLKIPMTIDLIMIIQQEIDKNRYLVRIPSKLYHRIENKNIQRRFNKINSQ